MSNTVEIKVPDIGDFKEVEVIEVLVKVGDTIKAEQSLITVESDKASMEIPASQGGVVKSIAIKVGDKVSEGSVVLVVEDAGAAAAAPAPAAASKPASAPVAAAPKAAPAPAAASASYFLQAGAYRQSADAEAMRARILLLGMKAAVQRAQVNGTQWYRVRVGPYAKLDDMNRARVALADKKISSTIVRQ